MEYKKNSNIVYEKGKNLKISQLIFLFLSKYNSSKKVRSFFNSKAISKIIGLLDFSVNYIFNQFVLVVEFHTSDMFTQNKSKTRKREQEMAGCRNGNMSEI